MILLPLVLLLLLLLLLKCMACECYYVATIYYYRILLSPLLLRRLLKLLLLRLLPLRCSCCRYCYNLLLLTAATATKSYFQHRPICLVSHHFFPGGTWESELFQKHVNVSYSFMSIHPSSTPITCSVVSILSHTFFFSGVPLPTPSSESNES